MIVTERDKRSSWNSEQHQANQLRGRRRRWNWPARWKKCSFMKTMPAYTTVSLHWRNCTNWSSNCYYAHRICRVWVLLIISNIYASATIESNVRCIRIMCWNVTYKAKSVKSIDCKGISKFAERLRNVNLIEGRTTSPPVMLSGIELYKWMWLLRWLLWRDFFS